MLELPDKQDNPWTVLSIGNAWKSLPSMLWSAQEPEFSPVEELIDISPMALRLLQLDVQQLRTHVEGVSTLKGLHSGSILLPGMSPLAQKYAGHRHGIFNDRIGDGRSLLLGEVATPLGRMEMYLKGGGRTPYALRGDGYLGLRSAIKEYLVSHALYGIGIPTSLPLSLCNHERKIFRNQLEKSATVISLSPSHARVGHFEWLAARGSAAGMKALIAHLGGCYGEGGDMSVEQFFKHSVQRTAHLAAAWQVWGFVAGTLNTDDISALGVTLDPGSGAFLESCQASLTEDCDAVDSVYAFSSQSESIRFGLEVLGRALRLLLHEEQINAILESFDDQLEKAMLCGMRSRLGLMMSRDEDSALINQWLSILHRKGADYNSSFRYLMEWKDDESSDHYLADKLGLERNDRLLGEWLNDYRKRLENECFTYRERYRFMAGVNPITMLRERDICDVSAAVEAGDFIPLARLRKRITQPYHNFLQ
jgi:uncharacterized protein YdiU (UPF0061 family)